MNILGVIIARGGSKRLPGKNIRLLGGRPLIAWSIDAARGSRLLTKAIVSTDDREIAAAAAASGGDVPFLRPEELASDTSSPADVLRHSVRFMEGSGLRAEAVVLLQATSPFRTAELIDQAIELFLASKADTVTAVSPATCHPYWTWTVADGQLVPFFTRAHMEINRADLPQAFVENGALYVMRRHVLESGTLYGDRVAPLPVDSDHAHDIDTAEDFEAAERIFEARSR
jgi:CMP-N-acetylneuraminic acid synthetase